MSGKVLFWITGIFCMELPFTTAMPTDLQVPRNTCHSAKANATFAFNNSKVNRNNGSFWIPQCDKEGNYLIQQRRQNGAPFCVVPATGIFLNWSPVLANKPNTTLYCDCFLTRYYGDHTSAHQSYSPNCDNVTGLYQSLQWTPMGPICVHANGTGYTQTQIDNPQSIEECSAFLNNLNAKDASSQAIVRDADIVNIKKYQTVLNNAYSAPQDFE